MYDTIIYYNIIIVHDIVLHYVISHYRYLGAHIAAIIAHRKRMQLSRPAALTDICI